MFRLALASATIVAASAIKYGVEIYPSQEVDAAYQGVDCTKYQLEVDACVATPASTDFGSIKVGSVSYNNATDISIADVAITIYSDDACATAVDTPTANSAVWADTGNDAVWLYGAPWWPESDCTTDETYADGYATFAWYESEDCTGSCASTAQKLGDAFVWDTSIAENGCSITFLSAMSIPTIGAQDWTSTDDMVSGKSNGLQEFDDSIAIPSALTLTSLLVSHSGNCGDGDDDDGNDDGSGDGGDDDGTWVVYANFGEEEIGECTTGMDESFMAASVGSEEADVDGCSSILSAAPGASGMFTAFAVAAAASALLR